MNPFDLVKDRIEREKQVSDSAFCDSLLNACEFITRHITAILCAALPSSELGSAYRYRTEFALVRSSGIGDWTRRATELLQGPNFPTLAAELKPVAVDISKFTRSAARQDDKWITDVVGALRTALNQIGEMPNQSNVQRLIEFLNEFPRLRNKMDAHGAPTSAQKSLVAEHLNIVVTNLLENLDLLRVPIVRVDFRSNRSAEEATVINVVGDCSQAVRDQLSGGVLPADLKSGLFAILGERLQRINLIESDSELCDFYYANGHFKEENTSAEFLNYATGKRRRFDCQRWSAAPISLADSVTAGSRAFRFASNVLTNHPTGQLETYVPRPALEREVIEQLSKEYRRFITLRGLGGIGKTTLALAVVDHVCKHGLFDMIIWVSARDLDLMEPTSKVVKPSVQSTDDVAALCQELMVQLGAPSGGDAMEDLSSVLGTSENGRVLWVLDNFETVQDPKELFAVFDRRLGPTNRVLITTRHREFQADWPIDVRGLEFQEFEQLVSEHSQRLGLQPPVKDKIRNWYIETDGHPYVIKMILSEIRSSPLTGHKTVINRHSLQDDLLERTYSRLSESAQILFLLISTFNSIVSTTAIRASVTHETFLEDDIDSVLDELSANSLVEITSGDNDAFVQMPSVARAYGNRKLETHEFRTSIAAMSKVLQLFGPIQAGTGGTPSTSSQESLQRFWTNVRRILREKDSDERYLTLSREVAKSHSEVWRWMAEYYEEIKSREEAIAAWKMFIECGNSIETAWSSVAKLLQQVGRQREALQCWVSRAMCTDASIDDVGYAANRVNSWLSASNANRIHLERAERHALIEPLCQVFERRLAECDADALSKYAHLLRRIGAHQESEEIARRGLSLDPDNQHCLRFLNLN